MYLLLGLAAAIVALVTLREIWLHFWLAGVAQAMHARGHREAALKLLERLVRTPSLWGISCAPNERFRLAWCYMEAGRPLEAAAECREILRHSRAPAIEANVRRRLADALESAGEVDAANAEREKAENCLAGAARDAEYYLSRAKSLGDQRQYSESVECYKQGLELIPAGNSEAKAQALVRLSLASFHAGQLREAAQCAEEALALNPTMSVRLSAHSAAAVGYSSQGLLELAERHHRAAYELAISQKSRDQAARYLASLAGMLRRRGKLLEAVQACTEATELSRSAWRMAALTEAEAFKSMGKFDQARAALARAQRAEPMVVVAAEKRSQATLAMAFALLENEAGRPDEAERWLGLARPTLEGDTRLLIWLDSTLAWTRSLQGNSYEANALLTEVERRRSAFLDDHSTWEICAAMRARALTAGGEFEAACDAWTQYLEGGIDPVDKPTGYCQLGLCRLQLGDLTGGRQALASAVAEGIDTHCAREARHQLEQLDSSSPTT